MLILSQNNDKSFFTQTLLSVIKADNESENNTYYICVETIKDVTPVAKYSTKEKQDQAYNDFLNVVKLHQEEVFQFPNEMKVSAEINAKEYAK